MNSLQSGRTCGRYERFASYREEFQKEGVAYIPDALDMHEVRLLLDAFEWKLDAVGDRIMRFHGGRMLQALGGHGTSDVFRKALRETAVGDIAAGLFGSGPVWFLEEQIFYKEASADKPARRSAWHQDGSFQPFAGSKNLVIWMSFDRLLPEEGLEVIRRSHHGLLYNGITNDEVDDTKPAFPEAFFPRVPDIEADRGNWDIATWAHNPGDVLVFHARTLHGGAACLPGRSRRSLALRLFGDDVVCIEHPIGSIPMKEHVDTADKSTVTEDGSYLGRFTHLTAGQPISQTMDWSVRPWVDPPSSA